MEDSKFVIGEEEGDKAVDPKRSSVEAWMETSRWAVHSSALELGRPLVSPSPAKAQGATWSGCLSAIHLSAWPS